MTGLMNIDGYPAVISYAEDMDMLRGDFVGLNGGANFYAKDIKGLQREGEISLEVFLDSCKKDNIEPRKKFSGKFPVRTTPELHEAIYLASIKSGAKSLNAWIVNALNKQTEEPTKSP
jgi:predicted HicB family RNase H-like nuclease